MTVGILAEKPSAAKHLAAALGGPTGSYNGEHYVIAAARGHLYEFIDPADMVDASLYEKYKKWNLDNLPWDPGEMSFKLGVIKGASATAQDVKQKLSGCDEIVIATDVDPTGEGGMIAVNAFLELKLHPKKWSRMYFTDEAPASLQKAFKDRQTISSLTDHDEYKKALYRSKWDLLSMQWTRVATSMAFESGSRATLRQGRLKSAMVQLVGDQLKAYDTYVKKPFFCNRFRDENGIIYTNPDEPRFDKPGDVPHLYSASAVVEDSRETKHTAPPRLLDLAALSSLLTPKGIKAKTALATYQKMYEDQVVSYPRTEDKIITPEQFTELAPLIDEIAGVVGVDTALLTHREPRTTHVKTGGAHGANRPGPKVPSSLNELDTRYGTGAALIYQTLAKNYLAMIAEDYVYEQQKGHVEQYPAFTGIANVAQELGWKKVFDPDAGDDSATDEDASDKGLGTNAEPFVFEGANKRPEHPSMKWLMKQLEKRDVGTGATRTSTYAEVTSDTAKYPLLVEKGKKLTMAEAGEMSYQLLPGTHIGDLTVTERVYADMKDIAAGTKDPDECLKIVATWVTEDIATMKANAAAMRTARGIEKTAIEEKEKAEGTWRGKKVRFNRQWAGHRFTDDEITALLAGETICFQATSAKTGTVFDVHGKLAEGTYRGHPTFGFHKLGFGKVDANGEALPPSEFCGHRFTDDETTTLIDGGSLELDDLVSKKGNTFTAVLAFAEEKNCAGKKIVMTFSDTIPKTFCKRTFTPTERARLEAGERIHVDGLISKKGKPFSANLVWTDESGKKKLAMSFD